MNSNENRGYYKRINNKTYGPYYYPRETHHWKPRDVARLLIYLKKSGKHDSPELLSAILDAFKFRAIFCVIIEIFVFFKNTAFLAAIILLLKLLKTLLNIWQLFSSGSLKVLRISFYFLKFEIANTILSKLLIRFIAIDLALSAIGTVLALYAEFFVAFNPVLDILDQACSWQELAISGIEIVSGSTEAVRIAKDIVSEQSAIDDAIKELLGMEDDINELEREFNK